MKVINSNDNFKPSKTINELKMHFLCLLLVFSVTVLGNKWQSDSKLSICWFYFIGPIVYNPTIVYLHNNFLKVVVHVIIIDQLNQAARLYKIQVP